MEIIDDKTGDANYSPLFSISGGTGIQGQGDTGDSPSNPTNTDSSASSTSAFNAGTTPTSGATALPVQYAGGSFAAAIGVGALVAVI